MKAQQQDNNTNSPENSVNYVEMFLTFTSLPLELFFHNVFTFGTRSAGARGAGAVLVMFVFASCYTYDNRTPLFLLTIATAVLAVIAHISAMVREGRGEECHTRYAGRPYAMSIFPISEIRMKRIEPLLFLAAGWAIHHWNYPLGSFVMTSASCQCVRMVLDCLITQTRVRDVNDNLVEQTVAMQAARRTRRR